MTLVLMPAGCMQSGSQDARLQSWWSLLVPTSCSSSAGTQLTGLVSRRRMLRSVKAARMERGRGVSDLVRAPPSILWSSASSASCALCWAHSSSPRQPSTTE